MPDGIISRFISRLYYLIKKENFWKNGVELIFENATALVISDPVQRKITISVSGPDRSDLLPIIRNELDYIHGTLNMEKESHYKEMIPCTCSQCGEAEKPYLHSYAVLKLFQQKGSPNICQKSAEEVPIPTLLKGVDKEEPATKPDLLETLISTVAHLQGIAKALRTDEDSRNDFVASILSIKGVRAKDQSRWGRSYTGKSAGRLDIKIENEKGEAEAVIESFNLDSLKKSVIDLHLKKLFYYDPNGLERNFILV